MKPVELPNKYEWINNKMKIFHFWNIVKISNPKHPLYEEKQLRILACKDEPPQI